MGILAISTSRFIDEQVEALRSLAPDETIVTDAGAIDPDDVEAILAFKLAPGVIGRFRYLRFIACAGAGVEEVLAAGDLPGGVPITRPRDELQAARMAQYVALMVLRWHRELPRYEAQQRERRWVRHASQPESQWPVGLMGFGDIGRAVARALAPLQFPIRAWTRSPQTVPGVATFPGPAALDAFLEGTRVLVCLLPLTHDTWGLLNAALFARLLPEAYLINASRGALVVEPDLLESLDSGRLAGAALDVHSREPLPAESALWRHAKLVVTPHIAAMPRPEVMAAQLLDNLARARRGEPLARVIDRERGY